MGKRQETRSRRRKEKLRRQLILIGMIVGFVAIVAGFIVMPLIQAGQVDLDGIRLPATEPRPMAKDNAMGDPDAPVKVVEYSDFLCGYCRTFALYEEAPIVRKYIEPGLVHFEYLSFSFMAPQSARAAEANYCAMEQGKFWEYRDITFENATQADKLSDAYLLAYAKKLGLDEKAFRDCYLGGTYRQRVQDDLQSGRARGVQGTPSFFVNDQLVYKDDLVEAIEAALEAAQ